MSTKPKPRRQCKACPWRKDVVPGRDIPNGYCETLHRNLGETIAEPGRLDFGPVKAMACHEFPVSKEQVCVGWLANQLGPGNNIGLRMRAMDGHFPTFTLVGEQHERFEDTLPAPEDEDALDWGDDPLDPSEPRYRRR